jgi:hypothetical protein
MLPRSLQNLLLIPPYIIYLSIVWVFRIYQTGYIIGHQLAQFSFVRAPVLRALRWWEALTAQLRRYVRLCLAIFALSVFIYTVTPVPHLAD